MMEMPVIRITLDHMRQTLVHAMHAHLDQTKDQIDSIAKDVFSQFSVEAELRRMCETIIMEEFRDSVRTMAKNMIREHESILRIAMEKCAAETIRGFSRQATEGQAMTATPVITESQARKACKILKNLVIGWGDTKERVAWNRICLYLDQQKAEAKDKP